MGEDIEHGLDSLVPCNELLVMGINHHVMFAESKDDLQLPNALGTSLIMGEAVLSCKDISKVDSPPGK